MSSLSGKVAIVTGSSRGIGARIASRLAQAGAGVVVNFAGRRDAAEQVVQSIEASGGRALAVQGDVSKPQDVRALFDAAVDRFGRVHILVNNAGVILYKRLDQTTDDEFDRLFAVNVKGVFNALREASRRLEDGGRIINFSSSTTRPLLPTYASYCATKAAVEQLTRIFAKEVGQRGITVNVVSPGPTTRSCSPRARAKRTSSAWRRWPPSDGSASRKTSPTSCCSWRATRPVGSPRRTLGPTAGWPDQVP